MSRETDADRLRTLSWDINFFFPKREDANSNFSPLTFAADKILNQSPLDWLLGENHLPISEAW